MSDARERQLGQELSDCVMGSSWMYTVLCLGLAIPLGVRQKSYMPVVAMGVAGSLLDLLSGFDKCKQQREALESYLRSRQAFGAQATTLERQLGGDDASG